MLNRELTEKWIAALRSGEYQQTQGTLCRTWSVSDKQFCCLGVACDLYDSTQWHPYFGRVMGFGPETLAMDGYIPSYVAAAYGIDANLAHVLVKLNDEKDYDFNQIADYLQSQLDRQEGANR